MPKIQKPKTETEFEVGIAPTEIAAHVEATETKISHVPTPVMIKGNNLNKLAIPFYANVKGLCNYSDGQYKAVEFRKEWTSENYEFPDDSLKGVGGIKNMWHIFGSPMQDAQELPKIVKYFGEGEVLAFLNKHVSLVFNSEVKIIFETAYEGYLFFKHLNSAHVFAFFKDLIDGVDKFGDKKKEAMANDFIHVRRHKTFGQIMVNIAENFVHIPNLHLQTTESPDEVIKNIIARNNPDLV